VDSRAHHRAAAHRVAKRLGQEATVRGEDDRRLERLGRLGGRIASPGDAQPAGEGLSLNVAGPGEGEHPSALVACDLRDDVRRRAEAVEPDRAGVPRHAQRAVADQAGAEQRRGLRIGGARRQGEAEPGIGDRVLRESTVDVEAGESGPLAEVLPARDAEPARPAGPAQPRNADPRAGADRCRGWTSGPVGCGPVGSGPIGSGPIGSGPRARAHDRPHDLVARYEGQAGDAELSVDDVQIGAADAARVHPDEKLSGAGFGNGQVGDRQGCSGFAQDCGAHWFRLDGTATPGNGQASQIQRDRSRRPLHGGMRAIKRRVDDARWRLYHAASTGSGGTPCVAG